MLRARRLLTLMGGSSLLPFSDSFDRSDGDLSNGWSYTPGLWTIASGKAVATPGLTELLANGGMELDANWGDRSTPVTNERSTEQVRSGTYSRKVAGDGDGDGIQQIASVSTNLWYRAEVWIYAQTLSSFGVLIEIFQPIANVLRVQTSGSWIRIITTSLANSASGVMVIRQYGTGTTTFYADDATYSRIAFADTVALRELSNANIDASVPLTLTNGLMAGIVICANALTNPSSFIVVAHDGITARLIKCVEGTYTPLIGIAATYAAGRVLRVKKTGTTVQLFYNGAQIGTDQTVSDAQIATNTIHGLFSTDPESVIDSFTAVAG